MDVMGTDSTMNINETAANGREPKRMEELSQMFVMFSWAMVALFILTNLAAISYCAWRKQSRGWL